MGSKMVLMNEATVELENMSKDFNRLRSELLEITKQVS